MMYRNINISKKVTLLFFIILFCSFCFSTNAFSDNEVHFECYNLKAAFVELLEKNTILVSDLQSIEGKLDLSYKSVKSIVGLEHITNVDELILSQNDITDITPIIKLSNLESLYVDNNWINELPQEKTALENLEHLDISNNEITIIPTAFIDLPSISRLYMKNLPLADVPDFSSAYDTVDRLDLSGTELSDYSFVSSFKSLELLMLNDCGLTALPDLSSIKNLGYLYLTHNEISSLPDYLGYLPLVRLDFSANYVSSLPESFEYLSKIEQLVFTDNYFSELPQVVTKLQTLQVLMCGQNIIDTVPNDMHSLENIKRASFAANRLSSLFQFSDFDIPYSYQISFDSNYLNLADPTNAQILQSYRNDGGVQRHSQLVIDSFSAYTDNVRIECSLDKIENYISDNVSTYKLIVFKKEQNGINKFAEKILDENNDEIFIEFEPKDASTTSYMISLELMDSSWPPVKLKYISHLNDVVINEAITTATPTPQATITPLPTATASAVVSHNNAFSTDKILLYILIIAVIMIVVAVMFMIVRHKKENRRTRR